MRQQYLTSPGSTWLMGAMLVLATLVALPEAADAQTRVKPINGKEGVASVVEGRAKSGGDARMNSGFAHLDGPAQHSSSQGLRLAGQNVLITNRTSVFPSVNGVSSGISPRQLSGRDLTVFGEITPRGIEAILVIVRPIGGEETSYSAFDGPTDDNFEPSENDPRVGRATSNSQE